MIKGPIHACNLQKRTKETHKLASSFFVKYTGSLLQVTHTDGAFEHMRQFGFCDQLVRETVKELLKVGFYLFVFVFAKARTFMGSSPSKTPMPYSLS